MSTELNRKLTRRQMLKLAASGAAGLMVAACAPQATATPQVIEKDCPGGGYQGSTQVVSHQGGARRRDTIPCRPRAPLPSNSGTLLATQTRLPLNRWLNNGMTLTKISKSNWNMSPMSPRQARTQVPCRRLGPATRLT